MPILSAPVADDQDSVKIHVVTPALARLHTDIRTVPPITVGSITGNTTLRSLETQIRQHLGLATQSETSVRDGGECNCSFARVINDRGLLNEQNNEEKASNSTLKFVVVYGRNNVVCLETEVATQPSILQVVHAKLGEVISNKIIIAIGGVLKPGTTYEAIFKLTMLLLTEITLVTHIRICRSYPFVLRVVMQIRRKLCWTTMPLFWKGKTIHH